MAKKKYKFNPESLSYETIGLSIKERLTKLIAYVTSSFSLSVAFIIIFLNFYDTPKTRLLKRENQTLIAQVELMKKDMESIESVLTDLQQRDDNIYRVIFETDPIPSSVRKAGFGGTNKYSLLENLSNSDLIVGAARKLDVLAKEAYIQSKSYDEVLKLAMNKEKMLACVPAIQPISNHDLRRTASGWGYRIHPIYRVSRFHYGMDFTASVGTPVYATGDGEVAEVESGKYAGYGNVVKLSHGFGFHTLYAHLSRFNVSVGQKVKRGDIIAYVGNSGTSTAPHLHYEVHKNGNPVNPAFYYYKDLSPAEYDRMMALSSGIGQTLD